MSAAAAATTSATRPRTARIASALALCGGAVLVVKGLTAAIADDAVPDWAYGAVYLLGIALVVAAGVAVGALQRRWPLRIVVGAACALGSVMWLMALGEVLEAPIALITDARPTQEEAAVVTLGVVWLAVGLRLRRR